MYSYNSQEAECGLKELYLEVTIGAAGAVGTVTRQQGFGAAYPANPRSLASIVKNGTAGNYTLNLDQRWQAMIGFACNSIVASIATTDGFSYIITARNLNVAQPNIVVQFLAYNSGSTNADVTNGAILQFYLAMKDSTV
jgi:hypothetical protein